MKKHFVPTQICLLLFVFIFFTSCNGQNKPKNVSNEQIVVPKEATDIAIFGVNPSTEIDNNIRSIFQDKKGIYWFGTNAAGVYRYDPSASRTGGKTLTQLTEKDGLANNQVQSIQEDKAGNIWFGTGVFGVSRYDGRTFTTFTTKESLPFNKEWKIEADDLWFYAGGGVYRYNGNSLTYLPFPKPDFDAKYVPNPPDRLSRYAVYCMLKDKKGNLWFGTQSMGVCRYDPSASLKAGGKTFTWFTEKGLAGPAILGLFEDKNGNMWFGNNGSGLFRYDPSTALLTNITEEKGLSNKEFRVAGKSAPGTLARVYSINEDNNGNLWIGTVDAGVWRYDGNHLKNYTTNDGLTSNAVNTIYKDKKGELWFGTDGAGVCKFNGISFTKFAIK